MLFLTASPSNLWRFRAAKRRAWSDTEPRYPLLWFTDPMRALLEWTTAKLAKVYALIPQVRFNSLQTFAAANALDAYKIRLRRC
jgi:hypothetical protein